jgi:hypothetical protein
LELTLEEDPVRRQRRNNLALIPNLSEFVPANEPYERYLVHRDGSIIGLKGTILIPSIKEDGYLRVTFKDKSEKTKSVYVHRIIAAKFYPRGLEHTEVDHINLIRTDCRADNLRWCTRTENVQNRGPRKKTERTKRSIEKVSTEGEIVEIWPGTSEAASSLGVAGGTLRRWIKEERIKDGFFFRDTDDVDLPGEEWREVKIEDRTIHVSNMGRITSGRMKVYGSKSPEGYRTFSVNQRVYQVHRLVCAAFNEGDPSLIVNHKNCQKMDNRACNLEFITTAENNRHSVLSRSSNPTKEQISSGHPNPVTQLTMDGHFVARYNTLKEAASAVSGNYASISKCCRKEKPEYKGFLWIYTYEYLEMLKKAPQRTKLVLKLKPKQDPTPELEQRSVTHVTGESIDT